MNVFSILKDPDNAIYLTDFNYHKNTHRSPPYVQTINGKSKEFALCPRCKNPVLLVNRVNDQTDSKTLYAKHVDYNVKGLASYDKAEYDDCPLANPTNLDAKLKRNPNSKVNDEIKYAIANYFDLLVNVIEPAIGISFSTSTLTQMLKDFAACDGHQYRAINLYNLPISFIYVANAQDLSGCRVNKKIKDSINTESESFTTSIPDNYGKDLVFVNRKKGAPYNKILFYFSNHTISTEERDESITLYIVEKKQNQKIDDAKLLYKEKIYFDGTFFFNTMRKREKLNKLAKSILY